MRKPTLLYTSPKGTTIHSYDIEGGHRTFNHYLKCYEGSCEFHETLDQARKAVKFWHNFVRSITYWESFAIPPWHPRKACPPLAFGSLSLHIVAHVAPLNPYWERKWSECEARAVHISIAYVLHCVLICAPMLTLRHKQLVSWLQSVTMYWLY